ncbi:MAG TPA: SapB/AmfS family lanthipeptide [Pseudonocardiaceae bacterium]|jgi:hypothetical protein|nr:SapB/AmfS family lanthipeptide [Pseudonocardiaceae bacterium]
MALLDLQALEVAEYCDDHDGRFGHDHDSHCGSGLSLLLCGN